MQLALRTAPPSITLPTQTNLLFQKNKQTNLGPVWDRDKDERDRDKRNAAPGLLLRFCSAQFIWPRFEWWAAGKHALDAYRLAGFFFFFLLLSLRRAAAAVPNGALEWLVVLSEKGRFKADRDRTKSSLVQRARVAGIC